MPITEAVVSLILGITQVAMSATATIVNSTIKSQDVKAGTEQYALYTGMLAAYSTFNK